MYGNRAFHSYKYNLEEQETKKEVLETLVHRLCPTQKVDITEQMIDNVNILEIDIQYMIGKEHIR